MFRKNRSTLDHIMVQNNLFDHAKQKRDNVLYGLHGLAEGV